MVKKDVLLKWANKKNYLNFPGSVLEHPLFSHGLCRWTGCEAAFDSVKAFTLHLARDHVLDERSTAQTRVQVSQNVIDTL